MAEVYPLVAADGRTVAICNHPHNADALARKVNALTDVGWVDVADAVPFNPKHDDDVLIRLCAAAEDGCHRLTRTVS